MLIRFIKLSFFCFVLIFLISCQSDDEIVEKPAELLRIDSKIDLDNPYYHEYDEWVEKHKKADLSVEDIGGLECGKCHY